MPGASVEDYIHRRKHAFDEWIRSIIVNSLPMKYVRLSAIANQSRGCRYMQ